MSNHVLSQRLHLPKATSRGSVTTRTLFPKAQDRGGFYTILSMPSHTVVLQLLCLLQVSQRPLIYLLIRQA